MPKMAFVATPGSRVASWPSRVVPAAAIMNAENPYRSRLPVTNSAPVAETEAGDELRMTTPQQLDDGAAHRVPDRDDRTASLPLDQHGEVIRTVGKREPPKRADPASVATEVGREDGEVLTERVEAAEPVQSTACQPAVNEQHGACVGRPVDSTYEDRASSPQPHAITKRQRRSGAWALEFRWVSRVGEAFHRRVHACMLTPRRQMERANRRFPQPIGIVRHAAAASPNWTSRRTMSGPFGNALVTSVLDGFVASVGMFDVVDEGTRHHSGWPRGPVPEAALSGALPGYRTP